VAYFDNEANQYDQWYQTKMGAFVDRVETNLALTMFPVRTGMTLLDAGCGTGNFSMKLAEAKAKVTGVDISREMLRIAVEKSSQSGYDIIFQEVDLHKLPFTDDSFDGVISMAALEFIKVTEPVMDELYRVLKPGGHLLVGTINRESAWGELYQSEYFQNNTVFRHAVFKTLEEITAWRPESLVSTGSCLFVPPGSSDKEWTEENEAAIQGSVNGGFICAMWKK
jgi:ubiquinone/menaquinone biosynthesis C-methylase UbiE